MSLIVLATSAEEPAITASDRLYADALERRGHIVVGAAWNGSRAAFDGADAVILRSTWGYYRALAAFHEWAETVAATSRLFNSIELVRWNLRKNYVGELADAGIAVPQSHFIECSAPALADVFQRTGWPRAVIKPISGASGYAVELVEHGDLAGAIARLVPLASDRGLVVQEFLPEIAEGEVSLVYFDGVFSHAIRKRPKAGEFRVNSRFGATREREVPSVAVREKGAETLRVLPELPLYARVDGVVRDCQLIVIEVEVLEPALFMEFDPPSAERFAEATLKRLG